MSIDRERILLAAALSQDDPILARSLWTQWNSIRPAMDLISPAETQCLAPAWRAAGCPQDPDEGRLRGLERQASVSTMTALNQAVEAQQHLGSQGIPSALTGGLAIAVRAKSHARAPLGVPQLLIEHSAASAALGRPPTMRERVSGSASLGRVHVVWRSPLREARSSTGSQAFTWQGRELITAAPHRAAFDSLAFAALTSRTADPRIIASVLDVADASTLETFDSAAWASLLDRSGLGRLGGASVRPYERAMPTQIKHLFASASPGGLWTRAQARFLRSIFVRTLPQ